MKTTQQGTDSQGRSPQLCLYGGQPASVLPAAGTKGVLIRTIDDQVLFRVYRTPDDFIDYEIRHGDLGVAISQNELAAFYRVEGRSILDHSPEVLGLERVREE
jgi:hypothetical protein